MNYFFLKNKNIGFVSLVVLATQLGGSGVLAMDSDSSSSRASVVEDNKVLAPEGVNNLFEKAKAGNLKAQDELVDRFYSGAIIFPDKYKDEFYLWDKIEERCYRDDKYAYTVLKLFFSQITEKFPHLLENIKERAHKNIPAAQNNVGFMYHNGAGIEKDLNLALEWFMKAAEQGDAAAQNNVGNLYYMGEGVEKNLKLAFEWYMKAAQQGHAVAQNNVGIVYYKGAGVKKDLKLAFEWFMKAAQQGHAAAQDSVGARYYMGEGVEKNLNLAFEWFMKAAQQGDATAQNQLGNLYYKGEGVEKDLKRAFEWTMKAAQQGYVVDQHNVGAMYYVGEGIEKDLKLAFEWTMKAAQQGGAPAQKAVGTLYYNGEGVNAHVGHSVYWWTQSKLPDSTLKTQLCIPPVPSEMTDEKIKETITTLLTGKSLKEGEAPQSGLHYLQNKYDLKAMPALNDKNPLSIPGLSKTYEKIASRISHCIVNIEFFEKAGFGCMLCPSLMSAALKGCLEADKKNPLIAFHKIGTSEYISFMEENVVFANKIVTCLEQDIPEINKKLTKLAKLYKKAPKAEQAALMGQQLVLEDMKGKAEYQREFLKKSQEFVEKKENFKKLKGLCKEKTKEIKSDIETMQNVAEQFKTLIYATRGKRHADFLEEYPIYKNQ